MAGGRQHRGPGGLWWKYLEAAGFANIRSRVHGTLEESDRVMRGTFFIGVYPGLTGEMIEFILGRFKEFFDRESARTRHPRGNVSRRLAA